MKPVRRWISRAFAILSLAICLATSVLWARSYRQLEMGTIERWHGVSMISFKGSMELDVVTAFAFSDPNVEAGVNPQDSLSERLAKIEAEVDRLNKLPKQDPPEVALSDQLHFTWRAIPAGKMWTSEFPGIHHGFSVHRNLYPPGFAVYFDGPVDIFDNLEIEFPTTQEFHGVTFPDWSLILLTAIYPIMIIGRKFFARRRTLAGHCAKCGYDLRATPDRCPECGTIPPKLI